MRTPLRVAVVARSVFPLHGLGGLERSVYDLVRHLARADVEVTLITRTPNAARQQRAARSVRLQPDQGGADREPDDAARQQRAARSVRLQPDQDGADHGPDEAAHHRDQLPAADALDPRIGMRFVPYRTFPFAGRRGTTVLDRSTAYPLFGERAGRVAWDLVESGAIDVVHGFGASVLGFARRRARGRVPLVLNPQGLEEFGATDPSRARLKRALYLPLRRAVITCARAADCVIATDAALEPAVRAHLGVPADRVRVIPNALDLAIVDTLATADDGARMRRAHGIGEGDAVLLSVGRIEENKGFHVLAAALGALRDHSGPIAEGRWRWVIVGDGPFRPRLEKAIAAAGLGDRVLLAGRLGDPELHAWYEAADLFVHPTLYEGSSLVTLEAMAHRRAVVATTAGGLPDKVRQGVSGWLVPPGDASALAAAVSGALTDPARLPAMGREGRAIVERTFSWESAAAATLQLYRDLLG